MIKSIIDTDPLYNLSMPEVSPAARNRWYQLRWPGEREQSSAWAERYFDDFPDACDYYEARRAEHPTGRVHRPLPCREQSGIWVVCVDPV